MTAEQSNVLFEFLKNLEEPSVEETETNNENFTSINGSYLMPEFIHFDYN